MTVNQEATVMCIFNISEMLPQEMFVCRSINVADMLAVPHGSAYGQMRMNFMFKCKIRQHNVG
jgi:hypothetical protein